MAISFSTQDVEFTLDDEQKEIQSKYIFERALDKFKNKQYKKTIIYIESSIFNSQTTYYWYVGQTNPSSMSSITPVVNDTSSPGWRLIGSSIGTYTMENPLWNGGLNSIITGPSKATTYVALPNNVLKVRDGDGNDVTTSVYNTVGTTSINNVTYYIYSVDMNKVFNAIIY